MNKRPVIGAIIKSSRFGLRVGIPDVREIKVELVRKSIHFLIALCPVMAAVDRTVTVGLLMIGTLGYAVMETLRLRGIAVPVISFLTNMASRPRDMDRFVLGPVTLGLGALVSLLLYPAPAASIAIYALAFGDGFASLIGKLFGRRHPAFLGDKSLEGSLACFMAIFISAYGVFPNYRVAFWAALTGTLVEALPLGDYDNIALPVTVGFIVQITAHHAL
ncbi:phosphatidate cytidylyltransferase [Treponema sp. TIM-1]|uniref:diacylglycerol/polyprenol kinase family protein n=1 Tax=Treponema sp. TIM-1 TaxID=2898417 RepID=UPI00397F68A9